MYVGGVKVHTRPSIQSNVTHGEGVESTYRVPQYRANDTHVRGVESA